MEEEELKSDRVKEKIKEYWDLTKEHAFFKDEEEEEAWKNLLAEMGHDVVGIDISEGMLSVARKKAKERGVSPDLGIGDAESLDFEDRCFDAVVSRIVLWTLHHPEGAISEWRRVLKSGGKVYAFESDWSGRGKGIERWIRRSLGLLLITIIERKNAWKRGHYSKDVNESLPLCYEKASSSVVNKVELFRKGGFEGVSIFKMEEVSKVSQKKRAEAPLRYKLAQGSSGEHVWYYIKGCKLTLK